MKRSSLPAKSSLSLSVNVLGGCTPFCHVPSIIGVPLPAMCPCCYYGCTPFLPCALIIMVVSFFVMFPCKDGCAPLSCALIIGGVPPFMMHLYYYGCTPFSCALIILGVCPCCYYGCTPFLPCALIIMVVPFFVMFPCKDGCAPVMRPNYRRCTPFYDAPLLLRVFPFFMRPYYCGCTPLCHVPLVPPFCHALWVYRFCHAPLESYYGVESASPTNEQTSNDERREKKHEAEILPALRRLRIRSSVVCFQPISNENLCVGCRRVGCRVQGLFRLSLLNHDSWQYCRIYGLDLPISSTITGMRGAAGGR